MQSVVLRKRVSRGHEVRRDLMPPLLTPQNLRLPLLPLMHELLLLVFGLFNRVRSDAARNLVPRRVWLTFSIGLAAGIMLI